MPFEKDQTVYLRDGREAIYVMEDSGQHFVRTMMYVEGSYDEPPYSYPDDRVTTAAKVYASPPVEIIAEQIKEKQQQLSDIHDQLVARRAEISEITRNQKEFEKAAKKYPSIQQALDFIEGRITHVIFKPSYGGMQIAELPAAFEDVDTWGGRRTYDGMKLLCLFGTDDRGKQKWKLNQYRDGSGSSCVELVPCTSEADAQAKMQSLLDEAVEAWRTTEKNHGPAAVIRETLKNNPWLAAPDDWLAHVEAATAKIKADKLAKLRAEIAELEGESA